MNSKIAEIDVHGFTRLKAKEYIYEEIKKYQKRGIYTFKIIHGFNNGNVIKTWLKNSKDIINDLNAQVIDDIFNPGVTIIISSKTH